MLHLWIESVYQTSVVMIDIGWYVPYHINHNDPINRDVFRVFFTQRNHRLTFHHIFAVVFKLIFSVLCHLYWSLVLFTYILLVCTFSRIYWVSFYWIFHTWRSCVNKYKSNCIMLHIAYILRKFTNTDSFWVFHMVVSLIFFSEPNLKWLVFTDVAVVHIRKMYKYKICLQW